MRRTRSQQASYKIVEGNIWENEGSNEIEAEIKPEAMASNRNGFESVCMLEGQNF